MQTLAIACWNFEYPIVAYNTKGLAGAVQQNAAAVTAAKVFFDLGTNVPGGLPFQPWAAEMKKTRLVSIEKKLTGMGRFGSSRLALTQ